MYENATMEGKSPWLAIIKRGVLENRSQNLKVYENLDKPAFSPQSDNSIIYLESGIHWRQSMGAD